MGSFIKYREELNGNGRGNVFWGRAHLDGAPFRGPVAPLLREEEFEEYSERTYDAHAEILDLKDPAQMEVYRLFVDKVANGLWTPIKHVVRETDWVALIVWVSNWTELPPEALARAAANQGVALGRLQ